ncbi:hypothetical protein OESDEN_15003 [Oesophagostomum dentatum]|uniref:Senescence domain-containing protein n=1 Tax=Oesophagostomum dentatum TaxID=61180 RepID=A0A0B1SK15_OESDE|nr:hypothetical protein OESDEN_15003 [Oesophagostomum dentatum]
MFQGDNTTAPTYPTSLQILCFKEQEETSKSGEIIIPRADKPTALIQVGPWVYPLVSGQTPVLRNDFGAYVVSNPTPDNPGLAVAIMLPSDAGPKVEEEFREVLSRFCVIRDQDVKKEFSEDENKRISRRLAQLLITGGERIAWGLETTTVKVTSYIDEKGEKYRSGIEPSGKPMNINPALKGSLLYMHKGTKLVGKCTRYLLDKVGDMGLFIGRTLATGAEKTLGKGSAEGVVSGTISVLGGGITGISTVWMALENNSRVLCRSIADQTVETIKAQVNSPYGDDASEATHHALHAAGHGTLAAAQLWDLGPRSVAGRMARRAGVQMVKDLHEHRLGEQLVVMSKSKYL